MKLTKLLSVKCSSTANVEIIKSIALITTRTKEHCRVCEF